MIELGEQPWLKRCAADSMTRQHRLGRTGVHVVLGSTPSTGTVATPPTNAATPLLEPLIADPCLDDIAV
jgi:hypothetical protein